MAKPLAEYQRKRDFSATPEPGAKRRRNGKGQALSFCIQKHDASHLHYDFRLELDGTLKSWAVPKGPSLDPSVKRLAVQVEDHPLDYASFEGHIPEGHYGAGDVIVWDRGLWQPEGDPVEDYAKGRLKFRLDGEKLQGLWNLVRTRPQGKREQWMLIKSRDEAARGQDEYDVLEACPHSVLSDRTLVPREHAGKQARAAASRSVKAPARRRSARGVGSLDGAKAAALPATLKPQLATLVETAPDGDWRYEVKFDGYRILARIEDGEVRLLTRNGHDWTAKMPQQAEALARLDLASAWLDGEMVVADAEGVPDFQALQNAFDAGRSEAILYYLFDVPYLNGMDLRGVPLEQRRAALARVLKDNDSRLLRFSEDFAEAVGPMLESACSMKLEGLIGKRVGSAYRGARSRDWIKLKCKQRQEFVILGYTPPKGSRNGFGALLLGLHEADGGALRYAGKVGTGFTAASLDSLLQRFEPLRAKRPALVDPPRGAEVRGVQWLRPELMCEVAYAQMTRDGIIRHSVFHGLREDKPAKAIVQENAQPVGKHPGKTRRAPSADDAPLGVRISHPQRVIDRSSGITKLELAQYYARVAPWLLRDASTRPLSLVRAPEGIDGEQFFQKHAGGRSLPAVRQVEDPEDTQPLLQVDKPEALVSAAQMGVIELHAWNASVGRLARPDRFILDLDPDPALPWARMIEATGLVLTLLDELGLRAFLKTSGGKGMHVLVPLERRHEWDAVKTFAQAIARHLAQVFPARISAISGPKNRVGKIFVDYLRNARGATSVCAYSARAREGLPVSVPIFREELGDLAGANRWTIRNVFERLDELGKDDPWAQMPACRQRITAKMRRQLGLDE